MGGAERQKRKHRAHGGENMDRGRAQPPAHERGPGAAARLKAAFDLAKHGDVTVALERRRRALQLHLLLLSTCCSSWP